MRTILHCYVRIPAGEDLDIVINGFEAKWGFPQCAGAVNGMHIPIIVPNECLSDYFNWKGFHSVIMQATVEDQHCFADIYIG